MTFVLSAAGKKQSKGRDKEDGSSSGPTDREGSVAGKGQAGVNGTSTVEEVEQDLEAENLKPKMVSFD